MNGRVYLDCNATAPIRPEAAKAVLRALEVGGNPSSVHSSGRAARAVLEQAREAVAALVGVRPSDVVFTSGGSEANALVLASSLRGGARRLIVGATEHPSVMEAAGASGLPVEHWPVGPDGVADLGWLAERLSRWNTADGVPFVALMLANNETGVIQPIRAAADLIHEAGGRLHVDAVQAAGRMEIDMGELGADTLALSAHKLGGPQGCGALMVGCDVEISRTAFGGGQERGRRGGTENLSGIAGFGAAALLARSETAGFQAAWRDAAAERLKREADVVVLGEVAPRLSNTLCFAAAGYASDVQVMAMDLAGIMVSAGSACSSGKVKSSHVASAMLGEALAGCVLRVSGGWCSQESDWRRFADAWLQAYARHAARARPLVEA